MKLFKLAIFLSASILTFSGCVVATPKPKEVVDPTLPMITLTKAGTYSDMKAVGFEWNSVMKDPRVEGIYIYKKDFSKQDAANKLHHTIQNRFATHYVDENVEPGSEYSYVFKTFSQDGESTPSLEIVVKTLPVLSSVSWIHVIQEMPRSAKILWRPHTNEIVKSYIIERKTLADDEYREHAVVKGRLNAEYIDMDLKDSYVYKYRIKAVTYNGIVSLPSDEVKVLTKALPMSLENIVASSDLPKRINLTWEASKTADFDHYNVYRSETLNGSYKLILSTKETELIDNLEEDGKDYFYRVSVVDKDGLESKHDAKSVHGKTLVKPQAPSMVGVKMVGGNLQIDWKSQDSRIKSYIVDKTTKLSWLDTKRDEFIDIKDKRFVDVAIAPKTTYFYKVYGVDEFGIKSEPSIEVKFTTLENEGRVIDMTQPQNNVSPSQSVNVRKSPATTSSKEVIVKPMGDFGNL